MKQKLLLILFGILCLLTLTACSDQKAKSVNIKKAQVGDVVIMGSYEQDDDTENGAEEIRWQVLAKEDNRLLLISEKVLVGMSMESDRLLPWKDCVVREWLNDTFLNEAFDTKEQAMIQTVTLTANDNPLSGMSGGEETTDQIFLLSYEEAEQYFDSDEARICEATEVAASNTDYRVIDPSGMAKWWLRSPGYTENRIMRVSGGGVISEIGEDRTDEWNCGVRPAMWVAY